MDPHNVELYTVGKGILYIAEFSGGVPGTYEDMGNVSSIEIEPALERLPHFSSRTSFRLKDKNPIIQTSYTCTFVADEIAASNIARYLMASRTAGEILAFQEVDKEYALRFVSDNPAGPNRTWRLWKCTLSPNGPMQLIGEEWMTISWIAEGLADVVNHSNSPYITINYTTSTTTTTTTSTTTTTTGG